MGLLLRCLIAAIFTITWAGAPALGAAPTTNAQMKVLAAKLGLRGNKNVSQQKRITLGEFLERIKPLMTDEQYAKFAQQIKPVKDKILPEIKFEANNLYIKEGDDTLRIQVGRDKSALISVAGVSITNAEMDNVDAAFKKIQGAVDPKKEESAASASEVLYDLFFPRAEAWLWPVAIIAAAGLLGFFIYKGLSNVNVDVSGKTQHNVEVTGGTENNINHNFNIFSSGTR